MWLCNYITLLDGQFEKLPTNCSPLFMLLSGNLVAFFAVFGHVVDQQEHIVCTVSTVDVCFLKVNPLREFVLLYESMKSIVSFF